MPRTKPSQINRTRALKVCEKIVLGMPLPDVCQLPGMPSMAAFLKWMQTDPAIGLMYRTAREISAYSLEELALSIARQNAENPGSPAQQKAIDAYLQQLRWAAEKRHPAVFSPRAAVNVTVPVQINTSLDLGGSPTAVAGPEMGSVYELTAEVEQEASLDDNAAWNGSSSLCGSRSSPLPNNGARPNSPSSAPACSAYAPKGALRGRNTEGPWNRPSRGLGDEAMVESGPSS